MSNEAVKPPETVAPAAAQSATRPEGTAAPARRGRRDLIGERGRRWMTALGKLLRTTAFKLSLIYLTVFALFAAVLIGYFAWTTSTLITQQITETINAEINGLTEAYREGGIRRLVLVVDARSRRPGSNLYLITTPAGEGLAGNIDTLQPGVLDQPGLTEATYRRLDDTEEGEQHALVRVVRLTGGFRLLVGRDLDERERLHDIMLTTARWSIAVVVVLGLLAGFFVTRRVLKRIDAMSGTARTIMEGDLSERLPIAGTGDELDRLAASLNAMLERIEALMHGLKEVSDNIAHDLRTPLTRLRNRTEEALRLPRDDAVYRSALETVLEESDGLIRTFNALLMIARAESGEVGDTMTVFDAAEVVHDVAELYEPLAEEKGLALRAETDGPAPIKGNRELISQALANLLDNAIKYAAPKLLAPALAPATGDTAPEAADERRPSAEIVIGAHARGGLVELVVADPGPGIPVEDRKRVVERFVRLEQSRSEPGAGLGLSLAAAVARLHRGELALTDNAPGLKAMLVLPKA